MAHTEHSTTEEKKSVNFWGPLIGGLVIWIIILVIETNLDDHYSHSENETTHTEQVSTHHE